MITPTALADKAKEFALEMSADAVVIVLIYAGSKNGPDTMYGAHTDDDGEGDNEDNDKIVTWGCISQALKDTAEYVLADPKIESEEPL